MSYDIYFVLRRADQSWDQALEELEEAAHGDPELPAAMIGAWERIRPQVESVLGDVDVTEDDHALELSHDGTGIELSVIGSEVSLTVPYWHSGDDAAAVFDRITAIAAVVEQETGLTAFDPQTGRPLLEAVPEAAEVMSSQARDLRNRYAG